MKTIREFADEYKVTTRTVTNWIRAGYIESVKVGHTRRIIGLIPSLRPRSEPGRDPAKR